MFYFVPGIILDHFRHPKPIFRYRNIEILLNFAKSIFDLVIDFLIGKSIFRLKHCKKKLEF